MRFQQKKRSGQHKKLKWMIRIWINEFQMIRCSSATQPDTRWANSASHERSIRCHRIYKLPFQLFMSENQSHLKHKISVGSSFNLENYSNSRSIFIFGNISIWQFRDEIQSRHVDWVMQEQHRTGGKEKSSQSNKWKREQNKVADTSLLGCGRNMIALQTSIAVCRNCWCLFIA